MKKRWFVLRVKEIQMTIQLTEKSLAMWYVELHNYGGDYGGNWIAHISDEEDHYLLTYRFRYYKDDKLGVDSEDEKSWYKGKLSKENFISAQHCISRTTEMAEAIAKLNDTEAVSIIREKEESVQDFVDRWLNNEFCHVEKHVTH